MSSTRSTSCDVVDDLSMPEEQPSFGDVLMSYPGGLEFERDQRPLREIDL